ncbi:nuclear transport factor 2 family protein [Actinomadura graeca]|uniref:Nuclear transport factor 2 family protein n=1 Tax=Actinomadura graeca TaxID=2750812 RepID=A0ABX8QXB4_9ACTN|nr:nuclear transport factor 2 family protein [Actinomadura graeca]QXJ23405.1 nuclear transport factor 2 family protein [Actinomadura graeca]
MSNDTYVAVQRFYAEVMQTLDDGKLDEFVQWFTPDGEFEHSQGSPPARTRAGILAEMLDHPSNSQNPDVRRRHWFGHMKVDRIDEHTLDCFTYAIVLNSKPGEAPYVSFSGAVQDVLVEAGGEFLIRRRTLVNDRLR